MASPYLEAPALPSATIEEQVGGAGALAGGRPSVGLKLPFHFVLHEPGDSVISKKYILRSFTELE